MSDGSSKRAGQLSPEKQALLILQMKKKRAAEAAAGGAASGPAPVAGGIAGNAIPRRPASEAPAPLSFAQQRLWLLDRMEPGSTALNIPFHNRLRGPLDLSALELAVGAILARHESLRTIFPENDGPERDGEAVAVVSAPSSTPFRLPLIDLSDLPEYGRRIEEERLLASMARPFSLADGPLFRAECVRVQKDEHLFLTDVHHIVSDGWSFRVYFQELDALYEAFRKGRTPSLPELPVQYSDFAAWQRERLQGPLLQEQLAYWRERLSGAAPVLELPLDRVRPAAQSHRGNRVRLDLSPALSARLRELSLRENVSPFMTLLAAFQLLLSRLAGQDDVVVGSPSAGRTRPEVEGLIGLFLNTLVLRTDLSGDPTFRELLLRVRETVLGAYRYQEIPFERLLEELQPDRQLSRTPIFQVLFNYVSISNLRMSLAGLDAELIEADDADAKFDFTLYVEERPDCLRFDLVYSTALFEADRMRELLRQLGHLLEQAAAAPESRIGALSLVTPEASALLPDPARQLGGEWHGAVHHALSRGAAEHPERLAVQGGTPGAGKEQDLSLTYAELESRANQLASFLVSKGVAKGDAVAVWAHRTPALVPAVMGTLKAGAAFLILDPAYPAPRLIDCLRIGRPTAWVSVPGAPPPPPEIGAVDEIASLFRCRVEASPSSLAGMPAVDPGIPVGPDDAACITFTSGSTGLPKGVVGRHGPLTHFYPWMGRRFSLEPDDRFGVLSALSHDPLQRDLFTPIWFGARAVMPDPERIGSPGYLAGWLRSEEVSVLHLTPAMMEMVLDSAGSGGSGAEPIRELPALRRAFVVGDLLKKAHVEHLQRLATSAVCVNLYGSTETQRSVSFVEIPASGQPGPRLGKEVLPLGRGMEDCQLLVLNRSGRLAGVGEEGEIYVRSRHLARGYLSGLNDEALTAERFVPNPLSTAPDPGDRAYRTGDLGRYLPDGGVEFAGRADFQVKLRGFRIELGEVEAALGRHPAVRECVVVVREDQPGQRRLAAYLVTPSPAGPEPNPAELRAFLASRLPDYMVPSAFVVLPSLPLTKTGKIDRRALPVPDETAGVASRAVEKSPVEELVAGIWADLLGLTPAVTAIVPDANFFELGGHSLLATRMISRVRGVLGVELPMRAVFEEPTLAGFSSLIERQRRGGEVSSIPSLVPLSRAAQGQFPASFSQQRLWFLDRLEPGSFAYNLGGAIRLTGNLDVAAFSGAIDAIVRRHESLRTCFVEEGGEPWQVIAEAAPFELPVVDLSNLSADLRDAETHRLAKLEMRRPYDLARGPLLRSTLLRVDDREHVLLLGMHHIVSDGWSVGVFVRELGELYRHGSTLPILPALPIQYADYAAWQRQWLTGDVIAERLAWWKAHLAGAPQLVDLPLDHPRPPVQTYRGGRAVLELERELSADFEAMSRKLGATPFMALLAGFSALLSRYGSQTDVVVGTPIANRGRAELEDLIGFFVSTLALRVDLAGDPRFDELARRVREVSLGAYGHQDVPFERLVDELRPERSLSHSPVFQVMLAFQNLPVSDLDLQGVTLSALELDPGRTQFDLSLFVIPMPDGGLLTRLDYASDLFEAGTAQRLLGHLKMLLRGTVGAPEAALSQLPLLTTAEQAQLAEWDGLERRGHAAGLLHELFEAQARLTPDALALVAGDTVLTYGELEEKTAALARRLTAMGAGPEVGVAICLERTAELVVSLLAVLRSGGFYVPLDPRYPEERRAFLIEDSGARIVIDSAGPHPAAPSPGPPESPSPGEGGARVQASNLAYLIYTSGSTGRPKAVAITHGSATVFARWARTAFSPDELRGVLASTAVTFDLSVFELFVTLAWGGTVVLAENALELPRVAAELPAGVEITLINAVPSAMAELLREGAVPASVRTINLAGEALPRWLADLAYARPETLRVCNLYGPSEDTTYSTWTQVERSTEQAPSIGRPVDDTRAYLLDVTLNRLPLGVPGELYLSGAGLARGYLGRPDLTAERFLPDPFSAEPEARMYRTGDLVRLGADGELDYLGRLDHQVKIRGFRIELGEVEAALARQPGVESTVVLAREDVAGDKRLVAYLTGEDLSVSSLRQALQKELPEPMVPSAFVVLEAFPLTAHGKVDRKALPVPDAEHRDVARARDLTPVEELLSGIWSELLGISEVAPHETFFELGGHSLLATRMISRVRSVLGVELAMRSVFEEPTLAGFAALAEKARLGGESAAEPPLVRIDRDRPLPTSFSQRRLWFLDQLEPGSFAYNLTGAIRLEGDLDVAALTAALDGIIRRHESLRTTFIAQDGEPWQVIAEPSPLPLPVVDLGVLSSESRDAETRRIAELAARRPYNLAQGPLLRSSLLKLGGDGGRGGRGGREHVLLLGMHHIVSDGWSLGVFVRELGELYRGVALPDLPVQYADYAAWQRQCLTGEVMEQRLAWWTAHLAGAPQVVDLPLDHPRPPVQSYRGGRADIALDSVEPLSRRLGVTPFMALLAGFSALLSRYGSQTDVVIGTPIANRGRAELEDLIGFFVNTLALRVDIRGYGGEPSFDELTRRVREVSLGAYGHQDVPFERLVDELKPERSLSHSPVFQVMLAYQNLPVSELDLAGLVLSPVDLESGRTQYDLSLFVQPLADGSMTARLNHASDLFDAATAQRILAHLRMLLLGAAEAPEAELSQLLLLTPAEQAQLAEWDGLERRGHAAGLLHELFEAQARLAPDALALVAGDTVLTYGKLEEKTTALARRLTAMGAGPEVGVAVCLERTAELVVSLLAVLRSGGFYVPLDPRYPEERRAFLIEDSGARIVIDAAGPRLLVPSPVEDSRVQASNLAYLIYTSGSTGRPKAVAITHGSATVFARWARTAFSPDELRGVLASTAATFDLSVFELFVTLAWGGTVVLAENALELPRVAAELPADVEITLINTVPSAMAELLREGAVPASVRTINLAGEALPRWLVDLAYARPETLRVCNLYGPSEDTTYSTWTQVGRSTERAPSIGRPVVDTRAFVLDLTLNRLPLGVPGELYLSGAGLARGYLGRPDLTAERFLPDPFSAEPGARMYRTGDLVRLGVDSELDYLGRLDHQVKIRGFRIELGEVEAALARQPGVESTVVLAREDVPGDKRLVAYVTGESLSVASLRQALHKELPEPMVPSAFVVLEALPLTPHGKVDRKALPVPDAGHRDMTRTRERTPVEELLSGIWSELLRISEVAPHETFFELGGHSLLATRMISRVRSVLGVELPMRSVFEEPTLAGFAALAEKARLGGDSVAEPPLVRIERDRPLPASFSQQRLWFLDQLEPGSFAYNLTGAIRLEGDLNLQALTAALDGIVRRHESLRTTFLAQDGEPWQVIAEPSPLSLPVVDLNVLSSESRDAETRRIAELAARRPYDLAQGPLLRSSLLKLGSDGGRGGRGGREHVLLLGMHHIVSDGWSLGVFVRELGALYRQESLPELPIQFADYAAWQRQRLTGEAMDQRIGWWARQLAGAPQLLELPLDRPRPNLQTYRGGRAGARISADRTTAVEALSRRLGVTPFMVLLAGFAALLSRHSGQSDVVVGTPIANRDRTEVEGLIGFFANTLALRVELGGDPSFGELARRVREMALGAYAHQDVPFERLVDELRPERSLGHAPLFQVVLALQNLPTSGLDLAGLTLTQLDLDAGRSQFDLSLFLVPLPEGGLMARVEYASDLFDAATIHRLLGHFQHLLEGIGGEGAEAARVAELPMLGPEERDQVVRGWNDTAVDYPREATIHGLFEEQARLRPGAPAVVGAEDVTYAELDRRANRLAARLIEAGVRPDERVGLCAERSANLIAALLGILKAGGAYVPLDPSYPAERLAGMLADSEARIVIVQEGLEDSLPDSAAERLPLLALILESGSPVESPATFPEQLAFVLFTSGSTGRPKGVALTHRNVVRLLRESNHFDLGPDVVFLQLAPVSFDASTLEVWAPLLNGGCVAQLPPGPLDLQELGEAIDRHGVTTLWLTSGLFHQVVESDLEILRPVRQLASGGDVLSPSHVRKALAALPGMSMLNGYGPTENATFTTCHPMRSEADLGPGSLSIGRPIANTRVYLLDAAHQPVPVGVAGQLFAAGDGLSRGYAGRPDLTAERFIPDSVSGELGARLYATGDLARWLPSGDIDFVGRVDSQVKIRGFRIELGEIESALAGHPDVETPVVMAREDVPGDKRLVAYVTPVAGRSPGPASLRAWVESRLPAYLVPTAFVVLAELPLGATGKVDRRALPVPAVLRPDEDGRVESELSPVEELVAGIWAELLGVSRVGRSESFFDLGGHSLLATRMISRVRTLLDIDLPLRILFEEPTLAGFSGAIEEARLGGAVRTPAITRVPRTSPLPTSFSQQRLWFLDRLDPASFAYNLPVAVRLTGTLDPVALTAALEAIVLRHEALRTTFKEIDGEPWQVISNPAPLRLDVFDLSHLSAAERETEARKVATAEARRRYDLARGPLFRAALLRVDEREHVLVLGMHHAVSDGWSMGILVRELSKLYTGFAACQPADLPDLPVQYADYAAWQRQWLSGEVMEEQVAWWTRQLADAPPVVDLPLDRPRPAVQTFHGDRAYLTLGRDLWERMEALSRRLGVTPFMTLLAAYGTLLHRYGSQPDIVVGTPIANRGHAELEDLIGFFANTLALRVDLSGDPGFDELAGRVRTFALGAYARQEVPFERLVEELHPDRSLSHSPVFQAVLALQNLPEADLKLGDLVLSRAALEPGASQFDLSLFLSPLAAGGGVAARMDYASDLFDAGTIERLLGHLHRLLQGVADGNEGARLSELPLLSEAERDQLLVEWNRTEAPIPEEPVHRLVLQWAQRRPDALALQWEGGSLTYGELGRRVEGLARRLRARGVGPEIVVGLCFERSPELVAAALAVLEAGGAYLPVDPAQPADRREWIFQDSAAALVLTPETLADLESVPLEEAPARVPVDTDQDNLAYVIYTSGSTGKPKGTELRHYGLSNLLAWHRQRFDLTPDDRCSCVAGPGFDASVWEIWTAMTAGASLHFPPKELIAAPAAFLRWMMEQAITAAFVSTAVTEEILAGTTGTLPRGLALRWLWTGGDRLVHRPAPDTPFAVANLYGPTECTVAATGSEVSPCGERTPEIGSPIANTRVYVLDRTLGPVPLGAPGELCLAGVGLARGYRGRLDLTAERFLPNPFGGRGERLYRTGDLVRWLPNGQIEYLGRIDSQVKIRGFRIEIGEVEAALGRQRGVEAAVVVARQDLPGGPRLVAYVVPSAELSSDDLRRGLQQILPDVMIPSAFVFLEALPLTPNGKIDRKALPAPVLDAAGAAFVPPRTPLEEEVANVWRDVLKVEQVGLHDSFWNLGGHSLLATRVLSRIEAAFGIELPLQTLFTSPTLAAFAAAVGMRALGGEEDLAAAMAELDDLSDDELRSLIEQETRELDEETV